MSEAAMPAAHLRAAVLEQGRAIFGGWLADPSPGALEALAGSALDYVGLDGQHGTASPAEVEELLRSSGPSSTARLVRVAANRPELIGRALDAGADGIIVPTVDSAAQAQAIVQAARFPPRGARSYGPFASHLPREPAELEARALLLPMIETAAGLQAVEAILAVDGIDGVYVGPADLGLSLGLGHAQFPATAELEPALGRVVAAAGQAGKVPGIHAASEHFAPRYVQMGFRLLSLGGLSSFVSTGVEAALRRAGRAAEAPRPTAVSPY